MSYVDIVFDKLPGPDGSTFIEVENDKGEGIRLGEWVSRPDGYAVLRLPMYGIAVLPAPHKPGCRPDPNHPGYFICVERH